jgi:hypothetical protein
MPRMNADMETWDTPWTGKERSVHTPHRGSAEGYIRGHLATMSPEAKWDLLQRLVAEEAKARQERAHEGVV